MPSLGAPHHSEQARSPEDSFGATACSFTSKVLVEHSVGSIAACVNPRRQHEARHRNISEPTPTTRSAASQRGSEPTPTTRSEASGQLFGLWFHDLGPACWTLGVSGGAAQRAPMSIPPCRTPVQYRCWGELRAPRVCVNYDNYNECALRYRNYGTVKAVGALRPTPLPLRTYYVAFRIFGFWCLKNETHARNFFASWSSALLLPQIPPGVFLCCDPASSCGVLLLGFMSACYWG